SASVRTPRSRSSSGEPGRGRTPAAVSPPPARVRSVAPTVTPAAATATTATSREILVRADTSRRYSRRRAARAVSPPRLARGKLAARRDVRLLHPRRRAARRSLSSAQHVAILLKPMASYQELLQQVKSEIDEVDATRAAELLAQEPAPVLLDVRELQEWKEGHIPRASLESQVEQALPDPQRPVIVYCAGGSRSAFAAKTLGELGFETVFSLAGGYTDWKRNGFPTVLPRTLDDAKRARYSRHLLIPEVGEAGQIRLLDSRILLIGAGGLGSPAALYLAAAGVGTIGIVDDDVVDTTNLQRQIVHSTERLGEPKAESAQRTIEALNPDVHVFIFNDPPTTENIDRVVGEGW